MLTSKQILTLIEGRQVGIRGHAMALKRVLDRERFTALSDQKKLLDAYAQRERTPTETYAHPETRAKSMPLDHSRQGDQRTAKLEPADIAWLQRLPSDPRAVTYADAVQLATFARNIPGRTADRRLLDAVWLPVKQIHDLRAAEADLANARQQLPEVPSSALGALAEAVRSETTELTDDEALSRASTLLRDTLDRRSAERDARIAVAEAQIASLMDTQAQREAVTA